MQNESWKVIAVDNFDRDNVSDILICSDLGENIAKEMADYNNKRVGPGSSRFYRAVPASHKLYIWEP